MKRKLSIACPIFILVLAVYPQAQSQELPLPEGRRLRQIVADKYPGGNLLIGGTTGSWGFNEPVGRLLDREFSYVTPENDFKHSVIRSNHDKWEWSRADAWLQHIIDNEQVLRIHGPIAPQCSKWAKEDMRTGPELAAELDTFMTALCMRYNGVEGIQYLDVVNEIALTDGSWHHPKPGTDQWEQPWLIIGQDNDPNQTPLYVKQAFAIADEHAPDMKLVLNNHCHPGTAGMEKVKETVLYLRERGYRVDGLGWQAHVEVGWATEENLQHLREVIDWCQERDLEFHITEFDAWILNKVTQTLAGQAYTYKAIMDVLLEKLDSLTIGWNTWHVTDAAGWKTERIPSLLDDQYRPKPAYYALQLSLESKGDYTTPYQVTFRITNNNKDDNIEGCKVSFNQQTSYTDSNGEVEFQSVTAGAYQLVVAKEHLKSIHKEISIFSDTVITLSMDSTSYTVIHQLMHNRTMTLLPGVEVRTNAIVHNTDQEGRAFFDLTAGDYSFRFKKKAYKELQSDFQIVSDTLLTTFLEPTHANVKFRLRNGDVPVNGALVVLEDDSLNTNSLGICIFAFTRIDSTYHYSVSKELYKKVDGNLKLNADTTIDIQFLKTVANVEFKLDSESADAENAFAIVNDDSAMFNDQRISKFYNLTLGAEYTYRVISDNYPEFNGSFFLMKDTSVLVSLGNSEVSTHHQEEIILYPNPAGDYVHIQSGTDFDIVELRSVSGTSYKHFKSVSTSGQINISDLSGGYYWLRLYRSGDEFQLIKPLIIR